MSTLLPQPTAALIAQAGREFGSDPETQLAETTLGRLFAWFPQNGEIQDVLPKVVWTSGWSSVRTSYGQPPEPDGSDSVPLPNHISG